MEFFAEIVGSFLLLTLGLGCVAQFKLTKQDSPYAFSFISVNFGFGFAVCLSALMVGNISGLLTIKNKFKIFLQRFLDFTEAVIQLINVI